MADIVGVYAMWGCGSRVRESVRGREIKKDLEKKIQKKEEDSKATHTLQ